MKIADRDVWIPIFFGIAACSWMPHWSCHYYRLETGSSFIVGNLNFSAFDSLLSMLLYSILIGLNLASISFIKFRFFAALASGILHLTLGIIHITRFINPFKFEVFDFEWSMGSSLREILIVVPFGMACIAVAIIVNRISDRKAIN
jgi:hypothetical protein